MTLFRIGLSLSFVLVGAWQHLLLAQLSFTNQTVAAGVISEYDPGLFAHWQYPAGVAVGDFNNDGFQDVFAVTGGADGFPDRLFMNDGDGTFTDQAVAWGLTVVHMGKGVAVGDYDKDGWLDIYVTSAGPPAGAAPGHHKLYHNNGNNTFTNVAAAAGVNFTTTTQEDGFGSCFGDYDLDGDLDLFVGGFAFANSGSKLFRNNGDGTFTNVTVASQIFALPGNHSAFAPRFIDMNGDFFPELLLAADFGTSMYLANDGDGTFTELTDSSGTGQEENGMGQTVGDYDGDGVIDWYVTSIYLPSISWTGNKLYLNLGQHEFSEISVAAGVHDGGYGWAAVSVDFDHDGDVDIAETNGAFTGEFTGELSYLWLNDADSTFTESASALGFVTTAQGRGLVNFDYDNDGDQDLLQTANHDMLLLFRNDLAGPGRNWLRVFLDTSTEPGLAANGIGSKVYVTVGGVERVRSIDGGDNFLSKSELSAHFGVGAATVIDELRVAWPNGLETVLVGVPVNQTLTITPAPPLPPAFLRGDANSDGAIDIGDSIAVLSWLFDSAATVLCESAADSNADDHLNIADAIFLLSYSFSMGVAPSAPFPDCGGVASVFGCAITPCP
ncbi:MAG: FG-GAP-like repeat-containing protein [Planctomycetota bacterium]